jgi:hypothetical protein
MAASSLLLNKSRTPADNKSRLTGGFVVGWKIIVP